MFLLEGLLEVFRVSTVTKCQASFGICSMFHVSVRSFVFGGGAVFFFASRGEFFGRGGFFSHVLLHGFCTCFFYVNAA